ncbi:protein adenylyltransferase SelO, mitochondrial-like [Uloborus diversus]|uniref:protein adenylyltransferase SelO, mitochondrial-like n=1 Tax=Uloborus diversus TaxID=327109 RepID=UPI00240A3150|nr:protein adenylyltransferase SelO, mitochondrial-like [Uloborus diversus]
MNLKWNLFFIRKNTINSFDTLFKNRFVSMATLETLKFDNLALRKLPVDPEKRNYVRTVNAACFSKVIPTPVENPKVVAYSTSAMKLLDLSEVELERKEFVEYFSGNKLLPGSETAAHCYCGHQFGYFSGQLGDGAAIYLGEVINQKNERWEIQLKGAGLTPYSRTADGRKVLRSSIREFLCSEAMHHLGIPTTRAGSCVTSDSEVIRDIFYDGHPKSENCSIVLRIAPSFIRFGSFEIFNTLDPITGKVGPSVGRTEILHTLLDYVIETFYPEIHQSMDNQLQKYSAFFKEVVLRTARLVALWQCVGFCHGVLNTDNMSILGITIDYGPFGFMDMYNPDHVCNGSDDGGRYAYDKQPEICLWNLKKLAKAIQKALPLSETSPLLELYYEEFNATYLGKMRAKLGLINLQLPEDMSLVEELFSTMEESGADFTNTFCCLHYIDVTDSAKKETSFREVEQKIVEQCYSVEAMVNACKPEALSPQIHTLLMLVNADPSIINQLGRTGLTLKRMLMKLQKSKSLEEMTRETKSKNDKLLWNKWLKRYKIRLDQDMKNCRNLNEYNRGRLKVMKQNNPKFILRNYILQNAIEKAEKGDYSDVKQLCKLLENPYDCSYSSVVQNLSSGNLKAKDEDSAASTSFYSKENGAETHQMSELDTFDKPPDWAFSIKVT